MSLPLLLVEIHDTMVLPAQCQAQQANDFAGGIIMVREASENLLSLNGFGS